MTGYMTSHKMESAPSRELGTVGVFFPLLFIIATAYRMIDEIAGLDGQKSLGKLSVASQARELLAR